MAEPNAMNFLQVVPFLAMLLLLAVLLLEHLLSRKKSSKQHLWITTSGMALIALATLVFMQPMANAAPVWGGLLRVDLTALTMMVVIFIGTALTAAFANDESELAQHGEFSILLVAAAFGLALMTISNDLIMLYLSMEMAAIPLYILAGFLIENKLSTEAGLKYLLYGALSSTVMVYGFSWLYGLTGHISFHAIQTALATQTVAFLPLLIAILLVLFGFGYKIAAVPFHFWAPDVYHGAPAEVSGYLATASKAAGFVLLMRFLPVLLPQMQLPLHWLLMGMAVLSMLLGNLLAMQQTNIKRLLAYSSIAHAGYLLVGLTAMTAESTSAILYYLSGYLFTNLAAFALAAAASRQTGSEEISSFSGLSRRSPGLALMFLIVFLSLAGIPPFAGFAGKMFVFLAAAKAGLSWLVLIGVLNSVLALFYYLNVLKVIYARPAEGGHLVETPPLSTWVKSAFYLSLAGVIALGFAYLPWFEILTQAGAMLWNG